MKINLIYINIVLIALPFFGLAQKKSIILSGNFPQSKNGQKISIMYGDFKKMVFDSARVANGKVHFELKNADSSIVNLSTGNAVPMDNLRLYISDSDITFTTKDSLKNATVSGNKTSADYLKMTAPATAIYSKRMYYLRKLGSISKEQRNQPEAQEMNAKMQVLAKAEKDATYKAIDENPDTYIALYLLKGLAGGTVSYDEMMPHYTKLSKNLQQTAEGKALGEKITLVKNLRSGVIANDFESLTPEGGKLKLSDILPKAKYTFVDFWASWCAPCRAENPNVVKAYNQYKDKGLTILSVSLDTKGDLWKAAIKNDGMPWLHVSKLVGFEEPAAVLYNIKMIPQNVLIDSKGKIVATNLRGYALEEKLKQLMN